MSLLFWRHSQSARSHDVSDEYPLPVQPYLESETTEFENGTANMAYNGFIGVWERMRGSGRVVTVVNTTITANTGLVLFTPSATATRVRILGWQFSGSAATGYVLKDGSPGTVGSNTLLPLGAGVANTTVQNPTLLTGILLPKFAVGKSIWLDVTGTTPVVYGWALFSED